MQPLQLDVASRSSISAAVQHLRAEYDQRLECLVNNAGVNTVTWSQRAWDVRKLSTSRDPCSWQKSSRRSSDQVQSEHSKCCATLS